MMDCLINVVVRRYFEFIFLFQSGLMFQIETKTQQCSKTTLTGPWDPYDIPSNSTFEDQYFIGGPGDVLEVQEWSDRKPARKRKAAIGRVMFRRGVAGVATPQVRYVRYRS